MRPFITFLTDFGLRDDFVGTCHGVIKRIAPDAEVIDITHGIAPHRVLQGALVLANTLPYMPVGVHLAVVDPGVGTQRRAIALRDEEGRLHVGPDNGLLPRAAESRGRIVAAHEIASGPFTLEPISRTFHGRDVFAPVAAHLANGVAISDLGPPIDPAGLIRLDIPRAEVGAARIRATILYVDHFGNIQLNLTRADLQRVGVEEGDQVELEFGTDRYYAIAAPTFADARRGDMILYEDAYQNVAVAISGGNAAAMLNARAGAELRIAFRT